MNPSEEFYRRLAENMSDLVALHSPDGRYKWVSPSSTRTLGYSPEELIGTDPYLLFHPDDQFSIRNDTHVKALKGDGNILIRYRIRHADGHYIWFETLTQPIKNEDGLVVELHTTSRDVTEQQDLEEVLSRNEAVYRTSLESLVEGIVVLNASGEIVTINSQATVILPFLDAKKCQESLEGLIDKFIYPSGDRCPPSEFPSSLTLKTGKSYTQVLLGVPSAQNQKTQWISFNSRPVLSEIPPTPESPAVIISCSDVTDRIEREDLLKLWSTVFQYSSESIVIINELGVIIDLNKSFELLTKSDQSSWIGKSAETITVNSPSETIFGSEIWSELEESGQWTGEFWLRDKKGAIQTTWASVTRVYQSEITTNHFILSMSDFNERKSQEELLRHNAGHDALTGLPNRLLLADRFKIAISTASRNNQRFGCFFLDLDKFKPVNDLYGHAVGDRVLQIIAHRMESIVRSIDTVTRIGGDEFILIIQGLNTVDEYINLAERLVREISIPIDIGSCLLYVGASVGIAIYPDHGSSIEQLLSASDAAMYEAKSKDLDIYTAKEV
ncbi:diguanylate cyclase domain-containing protein [Saccharospirillum alexandrii]|uniref:diguanylate cyclase domain-containing protein n=1 Tax=Saccharospirillum alexandrii TaxID=2448477 RepID=UPI003735A4B2